MAYCSNCGKRVPEGAHRCRHCNSRIKHVVDYEYEEDEEDYEHKEKVNWFAIVGFALSFVAIFYTLAIVLALIFGCIGLYYSGKCNGKGKELSIAAIVISIVISAIRLICLLLVVAAVVQI